MIKKKILSVLITTAAAYSGSASAGFPGIDYTNLGLNIQETIEEMGQHAEKIGYYKQKFDEILNIAQLDVEVNNNNWTNYIVRKNQGQQDVQNLEIERKIMPAIGAAEQLAPSLIDNCLKDVGIEKEESEDLDLISIVDKKSGVVGETFESKLSDIVEEVMSESNVCTVLSQNGAQQSNNNNSIQTNGDFVSAINPKYIMSSSRYDLTLTEEKLEKAKKFVDLIAPPYTDLKKISALTPYESGKSELINMQKAAYSLIPRIHLKGIVSEKDGTQNPTGLSDLEALQWFVDETYGDGTSMGSVAGKIMTSNLAMPEVIWRNMTIAKAFEVHMAVRDFKYSIKKESLKAISLGYDINNL